MSGVSKVPRKRRQITRKPRIVCHIKTLRKAAGLSQEKLAAHAGVAYSTIRSVESGQSVPNVVLAIRLAKALDTTVAELFQEVEEPSCSLT